MISDVQRRKLARMFRCIDRDGDGRIGAHDYDRLGAAMVAALGLAPGSDDAASIVAAYREEWEALDALARAEHGGDVTLAAWLDYRARELDVPDPAAVIDPYTDQVFALLDRDGDGRIGAGEIRRYLALYGLDGDEDFRPIVEKLDPKGAGSFTREEALTLRRDFYLSSDERAPGSWMLGAF